MGANSERCANSEHACIHGWEWGRYESGAQEVLTCITLLCPARWCPTRSRLVRNSEGTKGHLG